MKIFYSLPALQGSIPRSPESFGSKLVDNSSSIVYLCGSSLASTKLTPKKAFTNIVTIMVTTHAGICLWCKVMVIIFLHFRQHYVIVFCLYMYLKQRKSDYKNKLSHWLVVSMLYCISFYKRKESINEYQESSFN